MATHLPEPHWPAEEIVAYLRSLGSEENRAGMARFGINISTALVDQFYKDVQAMGGKRWDTSSLLARLEK